MCNSFAVWPLPVERRDERYKHDENREDVEIGMGGVGGARGRAQTAQKRAPIGGGT